MSPGNLEDRLEEALMVSRPRDVFSSEDEEVEEEEEDLETGLDLLLFLEVAAVVAFGFLSAFFFFFCGFSRKSSKELRALPAAIKAINVSFDFPSSLSG